MGLSRIVLRLARNPGTEFSGGDDNRGYTLTAPLSEDGKLDEAAFDSAADQCVVRRFVTDEDTVDGKLARGSDGWFFDYDDTDTEDDQPGYRLGDHRFVVGEYVTISDEDGEPMTYKVVEVSPA
jgi:hypothetical protein